ncbi:MAG: hypothetical protein IKF78_04070 [Atopobiaceae bacterium]|nr:hypothetical protein [Atopobiaceae bacterium]
MDNSMQLLSTQWRLCRIQLINWGTFDGYHDLDVCSMDGDGAASVVCITGKSGTGKSTLFDAGTVLMMPYGRTLNAASNLARGGSPRAVRTYIKGMLDTITDQQGRTKGKFLRDDTRLIWSAIVHTWEDTTGARFSAAHFFQLKPGGGDNDLDHTFVTMTGDLNPLSLEPYAHARFRRRDVMAVYPECTVYDGSGRFFQAIYLALGIGEGGDGSNAMKLLYRIQSGIPMTNVDDLFKELVLDPPCTFELAQAAIDAYDQRQAVWEKIDEAKRKRSMLEGIDEQYARMMEARRQEATVASVRHNDANGPFKLWAERHRLQLAQDERGRRSAELARSEDDLARKQSAKDQLSAEIAEIQQSIFERGGGAMQTLRASLDEQLARQRVAHRRRESLRESLDQAGQDLPANEDEWQTLLGWADEFLARGPKERATLQQQVDELGIELRSKQKEVEGIEAELDYYRTHHTCITSSMDRARNLMAQAAGLDPSQIPFAAELMDVPREHDLWRTAVNISLVHIADRILVDKRIERDFRRSIDGLAGQLGRRYHFDFVDLDESYLCNPKPKHVSSKVVYREDSPFTPYVRNLVCNSTDHLCVDTVAQLAGGGARITPSGQERVGNRGAIGHSKNTLIIGFSNEMLIEECEMSLEDTRREEQAIRRRRATVQRRREQVDAGMRAAHDVGGLLWEDIDVRGIESRIQAIQEKLERLQHDDELKALQDMFAQRTVEYDAMVSACDRLDHNIQDTKAALADLEAFVNQAQIFLEGMERTGVVITKEQAELVERSVLQAEEMLGDRMLKVKSSDSVVARARTYLGNLLESQHNDVAQSQQRIELAQRNYHDTFMPDDAEHGVGIDEYPYYHEVLATLVQQRLDEPESEWETSMLQDIAQHLSRLQNGFEQEERAVSERLDPVNHILGQFAFGEHRNHLSVVAQRRTLSDVRRFRQRLRRLTSLATTFDFQGEEEIRKHHRAMGKFIDLLRQDLATTGKNGRHFLDTRHMVHIVAHETPSNGDGAGANSAETVVYDSINGKSGGQYQELVAFILGAALLYCLGYNSATMPSYAPVYLDEAFIKADSEHTRRALGALSGLGFQVVIAVPDGKVEAVAPLASQIIGLTKDPEEGTTHVHSLLRDWKATQGGEESEWLD